MDGPGSILGTREGSQSSEIRSVRAPKASPRPSWNALEDRKRPNFEIPSFLIIKQPKKTKILLAINLELFNPNNLNNKNNSKIIIN